MSAVFECASTYERRIMIVEHIGNGAVLHNIDKLWLTVRIENLGALGWRIIGQLTQTRFEYQEEDRRRKPNPVYALADTKRLRFANIDAARLWLAEFVMELVRGESQARIRLSAVEVVEQTERRQPANHPSFSPAIEMV